MHCAVWVLALMGYDWHSTSQTTPTTSSTTQTTPSSSAT